MKNKTITPQECIASYGVRECIQILNKYPNTYIYLTWDSIPPSSTIIVEYKDYDWDSGEHSYYDSIHTKNLQDYIDTNPFIVFGSSDSEDTDILVIVDEPITSIQQCREICNTYLPLDSNLATVENGELTWVFKGTVDEVNNSILDTYYNLDQFYSCPVKNRLIRDKELKVQRCVRGLLSMCSRTKYRENVKQALKSEDMVYKFDVLCSINFNEINEFPKKGNIKDVYKFIGFQLAQTISLLRGFQKYTKESVCEIHGTTKLKPFIYKEDNVNPTVINEHIRKLRKLYENYKSN